MQILLSILFFLYIPSLCGAQMNWPEWEQFKQSMISSGGRVIDFSSPQHITTSEGQSYAMFFALVANDRTTFEQLLVWTENNLAKGSFSTHPIAWLWGKNKENKWQILDENTAVDSNLWIAYDLIEAGRLWHNKRYLRKGFEILGMLAQDIIDVPKFGMTLLPGKTGFQKQEGVVMNPSYFPPQLMTRLASIDKRWNSIKETSLKLIIQSSPKGFAPDWVLWQPQQQQWLPAKAGDSIGSYNAIRVYLWVGMMPASEQKTDLVRHFQPFLQLVSDKGYVPEKVNWQTGEITNKGPVGFEAALLPIMANSTTASQLLESVSKAKIEKMGYYNAVLVIYGKGWLDKYYHFNTKGELIPAWLKSDLGVEG